MENSLVNQIKQYISPEFISNLGITSGESEENVNKAVDAAIPALLLKLHHKGDAYLREMFVQVSNVFKNSNEDFDFKLNNFGTILDDFLGNDKQQFVNKISEYSNISETSTNSILKTSFLGILDYFRKMDVNFDLSSITNVLTSNLPSLKGLIPAGLGSLGLLGSAINNQTSEHKEEREHADSKINEIVNHNEKDQFKTNESPYTNPKKDTSGNTLKYILIPLLLGIVLLFFLYRSCNKKTEIKETGVTEHVDTINAPVVTAVKVTKVVVVNDGLKLNAFTDGIEDKLVTFLNKGAYKTMTEEQLKDVWFDFDNLNFEINTANVLPESQPQLENIAKILAAFPNVKIKVGGYTDKTGNEAHNKKLSNERALAVKKFLEAKGLGKQVVGAEGYGSEFAKHPADASEELRVTDRKVAVSVRN